MKKLIAFDLDGTLAPSKSYLPDEMSDLLGKLLQNFQVCVISGGKFDQFKTQLLDGLKASPAELSRLHLMPTCGTQYYIYDMPKADWHQVYAENFTDEQKQKITAVLQQTQKALGFIEPKTWGETIEDRGSQITLSFLGQDVVAQLGEEGVKLKEDWDADNSKKNAFVQHAAPLLPGIEVRAGGLTSIDVTRPGIDKAYGMQKLMDMLQLSKEDILFIGDRIMEGGNDYPVKAFGIDTIAVNSWQNTAQLITGILHVV